MTSIVCGRCLMKNGAEKKKINYYFACKNKDSSIVRQYLKNTSYEINYKFCKCA